MSKLKQLIRRLTVEAGVIAALLAVAGGVYVLSGNFADSAAQKKSQAEAALSQDTTQLNSVRSQLNRSGEAEKRFVQIQLNRTNLNFSNNVDALKDWMRDAKNRFRFANNFKLNLPPEKPSDKPELSGLDYDISTRNDITIELEAISDIHVYSFVNDLENATPGIVRITSLEVERHNEMTAQTLTQMAGGVAPGLVTAKIKFDWVGVNPKETPAPAAAPAAPPPNPGGM